MLYFPCPFLIHRNKNDGNILNINYLSLINILPLALEKNNLKIIRIVNISTKIINHLQYEISTIII